MRRASLLRSLAVLSLWFGLVACAYGQEEPRNPIDPRIMNQTGWPSGTIDLTAFDRAMAEIKMKQPVIPDSILGDRAEAELGFIVFGRRSSADRQKARRTHRLGAQVHDEAAKFVRKDFERQERHEMRS